jgi:serine protease inhibitor
MNIPVASYSLNQLTLSLFEHLNALNAEKSGDSGNLLISPIGVSTLLALSLPGADNDTSQQLEWFLSAGGMTKMQVLTLHQLYSISIGLINQSWHYNLRINVANRIFVNEKFALKSEYSQTLSKMFDASANDVDFSNPEAAAAKINSSFAENANLIDPTLLEAALDRLVLVNTTHLNALWFEQFHRENTARENFHLSDGSTIQVDMMKQYSKRLKYLIAPGGLKANVVEIPYRGSALSMNLILPNEGTPLAEVERELDQSAIDTIVSARAGTNNQRDKMNIQLPRFKIEFKSDVSICFVFVFKY